MEHIPVLFNEVKNAYLSVSPRKFIIDATQGLGGHTKMLCECADDDAICVGIDRDADNIILAQKNLESCKNHRAFHKSFAQLDEIMEEFPGQNIDFILYDLGVSSAHYDDGSRGFSLRFNGPLDMRFDRTCGKTAADIVMNESEDTLKKIFSAFADEKKAHFIARAIVEHRKKAPIQTTFELLEIIRSASFDKKSPLRVFQALRIAANHEFDHIISSLESACKHLRVGGKIAIITFHSIEDRLVKQFFLSKLQPEIDDFTGKTLTPAPFKKDFRKPIIPEESEISSNPRARSAKLRMYQKIS